MFTLLQHSVENAEQLIKRLESFITTTMDANDDKINSVVALGRELIAENNYASDKIQQKADSLEDRYVLFLSGGNKLFDFFTEYIYNGKFKCH